MYWILHVFMSEQDVKLSVSANVCTDSWIFLLTLQFGSTSGIFYYFGIRKDPSPLSGTLLFSGHRALILFASSPFRYFVRYASPCIMIERIALIVKMSCLWTKYINSSQLNMLTCLCLLAGKRWRHRRGSCSTRWWQGLMFVLFRLKSKMKILAPLP